MAKKGMKRYYISEKKGDAVGVPELQGKVKSDKKQTTDEFVSDFTVTKNSALYDTDALNVSDNDLAIENIINDFDLTAADVQDFRG